MKVTYTGNTKMILPLVGLIRIKVTKLISNVYNVMKSHLINKIQFM